MVINQPFAIGDILFLEPVYRHFLERDGEKPTVPLADHLMWIAEYIDSAKFIPRSAYSGINLDSTAHNAQFINMRFANQILRGYAPHDHHDFENMMLDKYRLLGLPEDMWKGLKIKFNQKKGEELMDKVLNGYDDDFILINNHSQAGEININLNFTHELPFYRMRVEPGYTVLDWYMVMMEAEENHHVSTSTFYVMQAIKNAFPEWNKKAFIYARPNIDGLKGISQLKTDYNYYPVRNA